MRMHRIYCLLAAIAMLAMARAGNVISLSSAADVPTKEVTIQVSLSNTDTVSALEIDLPLGNALQYVEGSCTLASDRDNGHTLVANQVGEQLRIYLYSLSLSPLKGNSGELLTFRLLLGKEPAAYPLQPEVVLSNAAGESMSASVQAGEVTILAPKLAILTPQIDYGHIPIRSVYTRTLQMQNKGTSTLTVQDILINDTTFLPLATTLTIQPQATASVTLQYSPVVRGSISRSVQVMSDAVNGVQKMFQEEGLNDFVPKPMELKILVNAVRKWLPKEKLQMRRGEILDVKPQMVERAKLPQIGDLDIQVAYAKLGSEKLFWSVLKEYYRVIGKKCALIQKYREQHDRKAYTVEVHALKSASRQIGAMRLADLAERLEAAGNGGDDAMIDAQTDALLEKYRSYQEILAPWCAGQEKKETLGQTIPGEELQQALNEMQEAVDELDMDAIEMILERLMQYQLGDSDQELLAQLQEACADFDAETCEALISEWKKRKQM